MHKGKNVAAVSKYCQLKHHVYLTLQTKNISTLIDSFNWTHKHHGIGKSKMFILLKQKFIFIYTLSINLPVYSI